METGTARLASPMVESYKDSTTDVKGGNAVTEKRDDLLEHSSAWLHGGLLASRCLLIIVWDHCQDKAEYYEGVKRTPVALVVCRVRIRPLGSLTSGGWIRATPCSLTSLSNSRRIATRGLTTDRGRLGHPRSGASGAVRAVRVLVRISLGIRHAKHRLV